MVRIAVGVSGAESISTEILAAVTEIEARLQQFESEAADASSAWTARQLAAFHTAQAEWRDALRQLKSTV